MEGNHGHTGPAPGDPHATIARLERALEDATIERDFFLGEVRLRNRIPSTAQPLADLLRRAEAAEALIAGLARACIDPPSPHPSTPTRRSPMATDPRSELIERMAKAMCARDGFDWDAQSCMDTAGGEEPEEQRAYWRDKAEAALVAIAEDPTPT